MEDKHLDNIIREKLGQMDVPYQPSTWDALEKRMDAEAEDEQTFDESIRQKLHGWESNYEHLHWNLLSKQLEAAAIRRLLYRYKATELLLILLLLFTMGQFLPTHIDSSAHQELMAEIDNGFEEDSISIDLEKEEQQSILAIPTILNNELAEKTKVTNSKAKEKTSPKQTFKSSSKQISSTVPILVHTKLEQLASISSSTSQETEYTKNAPITPLNAPIPPVQLRSSELSLVEATQSEKGIDALEIFGKKQVKQLSNTTPTRTFTKHEPTASSETSLAPIQQRGRFLNTLLRLSAKQVQLLEQQKRTISKSDIATPLSSNLLISFLSSANADYINRPANVQLETSEYNELTIGYSSGLSIGWKRGRFAIETALLYTNKSDSLERRTIYIYGNTQDGYFAESLSKIDFEIFELPLQIQYDVISKNRWRVYPVVGASIHLANKITYTIERAGAEGLGQTETPSSEKIRDKFLDNSSLSQRPDYDRLSAQQNHDGWQFGKGNFKANSYFSANAGVGVSYRISDRCSIFAQPMFKYNLSKAGNGLGPNNDRIHTTALLVGIQAGI